MVPGAGAIFSDEAPVVDQDKVVDCPVPIKVGLATSDEITGLLDDFRILTERGADAAEVLPAAS
jgi:hypothetical protein